MYRRALSDKRRLTPRAEVNNRWKRNHLVSAVLTNTVSRLEPPKCASIRSPLHANREIPFLSMAASNAQRASELIPHRTLISSLGSDADSSRPYSSWCRWQAHFVGRSTASIASAINEVAGCVYRKPYPS